MSKAEGVTKILEEMEGKISDIIGSAVIRTDGLVIASAILGEIDDRRMAAMSAALIGTSNRVAQSLFNNGVFTDLNLGIDNGNMFLVQAGRVLLVAMTKKNPNIGLIRLEMEDASKQIRNIFQV